MTQFRFSSILSNIANILGRTRQMKENSKVSSIAALPRPEGSTASISDSGRIKFGAGLRHASR